MKTKFSVFGLALAFLVLAAIAASPGVEQCRAEELLDSSSEVKLKAAFVFNFTKLVDWPSFSFSDANAPLILCSPGNDPITPLLLKLTEGKTVKGRSLKVAALPNLREASREAFGACHLLYFGANRDAALGDLASWIDGAAVLTVGDGEDFTTEGGMIGLVLDGPKIRFHINNTAAERHGIKIGSKLLSLGKTVQ